MSLLAKIDAQMNYILSLIKQMPKSSKKTSSSLLISSGNNKNENAVSSLLTLETNNQSDLITYENFPFSHLCNRDIRDLPLSKINTTDVDRLRSCYILTMTDLIGRYLIHKTPDEFRQFLLEKVQCSQSFTDEISQLMYTWTLQNLLIGKGTRTTRFKQYL